MKVCIKIVAFYYRISSFTLLRPILTVDLSMKYWETGDIDQLHRQYACLEWTSQLLVCVSRRILTASFLLNKKMVSNKTCLYFFMLALLKRRTSFWPPSMAYISVIINTTLQITFLHVGPSVGSFPIYHVRRNHQGHAKYWNRRHHPQGIVLTQGA